jgi:hypothetical protein
MNRFEIKYKTRYSFPFFIIGFGQLFYGCMISFYSLSGFDYASPVFPFIIGLLFIIIAIAFLVSPIVVFTDKEVQVKNVLGMVRRSYSYMARKIIFEGRTIYAGNDKIISGFLIQYDKDELQRFLEKYHGD